MFQDLNELFLFFRDKDQIKENAHNKTVKLNLFKNNTKSKSKNKTMKTIGKSKNLKT